MENETPQEYMRHLEKELESTIARAEKLEVDIVELHEALTSHQNKYGHFPSCGISGMYKPVDHPPEFLKWASVARCECSRNILAMTTPKD